MTDVRIWASECALYSLVLFRLWHYDQYEHNDKHVHLSNTTFDADVIRHFDFHY